MVGTMLLGVVAERLALVLGMGDAVGPCSLVGPGVSVLLTLGLGLVVVFTVVDSWPQAVRTSRIKIAKDIFIEEPT
jgi:hypothetical protein